MKILSINVGRPREVTWRGATVTTGIFKAPVAGRVVMRTLNLDGDGQADLSVHGGPAKAVYAYPSEHYAFWRSELPGADLAWGAFGENLTVEGLLEDAVHVGDRFRMGAAEVVVTQPRLPCHKLGVRFGRQDIVDRFLASGRTGFYLGVIREGAVGAGDAIEWAGRDPHRVAVADVARLRVDVDAADGALDLLRRVVQVEALPERLRSHFSEKLRELGGGAPREGTR